MKTKHFLLTRGAAPHPWLLTIGSWPLALGLWLLCTVSVSLNAQTTIPAVFERTPDVVLSPLDQHSATVENGLTKDGVTLTFAKGSGTQTPTTQQDDSARPYIQLYQGNTVTITCADTLLGIYWGGEGSWQGLDVVSAYSSGNIYSDPISGVYWYGETTELVFTVGENGWSFGLAPPISIYLKKRHESITLTDGKIWPDAALLYDFDGNGYKGGWQIDDYANGFAPKSFTYIVGEHFGQGDYLIPNGFMEDVNRDGIIDGGSLSYYRMSDLSNTSLTKAYDRAAISEGDSYRVEDALLLHNCDLNNDGRPEMLQIKGGNDVYFYNILYQQADGSFLTEPMEIFTEEEYLAQFDPSKWSSAETQNTYGLLFPNTPVSTPMLSAVSISEGRAPKRRVIAKSPGMGARVNAPTKAIDMNADGRIDLVNEAQGIVFYNMGDNKWVEFDAGGEVHTADLNNDGHIDFIYPGTKLTTLIYDGNGKYKQQVLFQNLQVDKTLYAYDFDRDGDVDILVTFSAPGNSTGFAYTMFFQNDGQGNFTQMEEQDSGELQLVFAACQDINGDGYYDLLAFSSFYYNDYYGSIIGDEVYVLYGQKNLTFAPAQKLYDVNLSSLRIECAPVINGDYSSIRLDVEDIDNDGKMEVWASLPGSNQSNGYQNTYIFKPQGTTTNTAPVAPAKPEIIYENGMMRVSWTDGSDNETMTSDLTYALRIGTTSGGNDILTSHALADGSRRDFLDGNMGKNHSYVIDLRSYAPSTIYVAVQTIDAQHKGSAWSEEAIVQHNTLPAIFAVDKKQVLIGDTLQIIFTALDETYTQTWELAGGQEVTAQPQSKQIIFSAEGIKTLTHTVSTANGATASYVVNVEVMPVRGQSITIPDEFAKWNDEYNIYTRYIHTFADYNFDGYLDAEYNNAFYKGGAEYTFSKASGIWNTGLQIEDGFWFDYTHNGAADFIYRTYNGNSYSYSYMPHNGTNNLTATQTADELNILETAFAGTGYQASSYDIYHDGYFTAISLDALTNNNYGNAVIRNADGSWSKTDFEGLPDGDSNSGKTLQCIGILDFNHDGFVDFVYVDYRVNPITELPVALNQGGGVFNTISIPFTQALANVDNWGDKNDQMDVREPMLADLNSDGYWDIIAFREDKAPYILYNEANERFLEPIVLPLGEHREFYKRIGQIADIDNNGYPDILILQRQINNEGGYTYSVYAYFMDGHGIKSHGTITTLSGYNQYGRVSTFRVLHIMPEEWLVVGDGNNGCRIQGASNERPSAPTGLRAVQTEDGLLIEWNAAADDHTPTTQMRYNLSVKHAGQTGNGAFVISPQNGLNANAAAIPTYQYISANCYIVPISALSAGNYEIQIQAVDMQNAMSLFSDVVTVAIDRAVIEAPTTICSEDEAIVNYMGEDRTGTPQWDFDGGTAIGSGFGPYHVTWTTPGIKTITLTLGNETFSRTILVDKNDNMIALPQYLFEGNSTTLDYIPKDMQAEWRIYYRGEWKTLDENGINGVMKDKLNVRNGIFTVGANATQDEYLRSTTLELTLTNKSGCTSVMQQPITILSADEIPQITIVTPEANGHNQIVWAETLNAMMFPRVEVLKETNIYNQFVSLGTVSTTNGNFTDLSSQPDQRAERYAIVGIMANGVNEAPRSDVHQTVHLNINRGMTENTFNLIWNAYQGADIATYTVLRGSSAETLQPIASLSGANTSYTDYAPSSSETYYAIEYSLSQPEATAPRRVVSAALTASNRAGRSNIVNRAAANSIVYTQSLTIMSTNKQYATTEDQLMFLLYAEFKPTSTTIKAASWEIIDGGDLATIDPTSGLLTARTPNAGGVVTVKATAKDGSGITATRQITIAAIKDDTPIQTTYYTIRFLNWDGTELQSTQVEEGKTPAYTGATPIRPEDDEYTYAFSGWSLGTQHFQPADVLPAATADADYTAIFTATAKPQPKDYTPQNLTVVSNTATSAGASVMLQWNIVQGVEMYELVVREGDDDDILNVNTGFYTQYAFDLTSDNLSYGTHTLTWFVRSVIHYEPVSDYAEGPAFVVTIPQTHDLDDQMVNGKCKNEKILIDGVLYIVRPDGIIFNAQGARVK